MKRTILFLSLVATSTIIPAAKPEKTPTKLSIGDRLIHQAAKIANIYKQSPSGWHGRSAEKPAPDYPLIAISISPEKDPDLLAIHASCGGSTGENISTFPLLQTMYDRLQVVKGQRVTTRGPGALPADYYVTEDPDSLDEHLFLDPKTKICAYKSDLVKWGVKVLIPVYATEFEKQCEALSKKSRRKKKQHDLDDLPELLSIESTPLTSAPTKLSSEKESKSPAPSPAPTLSSAPAKTAPASLLGTPGDKIVWQRERYDSDSDEDKPKRKHKAFLLDPDSPKSSAPSKPSTFPTSTVGMIWRSRK
jgi:hypothetical protein